MADVEISRDDEEPPVAIVTLNRPDRLNAIVPGMLEAYADALGMLDADPDVRAIVVTGAGRGFCSGADLAVLAEGPQALRGYLDGLGPERLPTSALALRTPVVTAVNGPCAGIGVVLALAADVRIASHSATFTTAFSRLGLVAEYGIAWLLPRLVGLGTATEWLLSGRSIDAGEAARAGLVQEVADDALTASLRWARTCVRQCSPDSIAAMKAQLLEAQTASLDASVSASLKAMARSFEGPDLAEAIAARSEGRPTRFTGSGGDSSEGGRP